MHELTISSKVPTSPLRDSYTTPLYKCRTGFYDYRHIGSVAVVDGELRFSLSDGSETIRVDNFTFELKKVPEETAETTCIRELESRVAELEERARDLRSPV